AYISDVNGEDEVYIQQANETGTAKQLTKNGDTYKYAIDWSPDSKYIAWSDNKLRLFYVNVETGNITLADQGKTWEHNSWNWSPDSRWLAFSRSDDDRVIKIFLHNLATKENTLVTDAWYESHSPSFSDDGKFLLFVSDRDFNPTYSNTEWNHAYSNMSKVYMMALTKKTPSPFSPKNDEVREVTESKPEDEKSNTNKPSDKTDKPKEGINNPVDIDFDGIQGRIVSLPISAANYWHANMVGNMVYYMHSKTGADDVTLKVYDLKERKETEVGQVSSYGLTADNKKMLINKDSKYYIIELPKSKAELKDAVDLSAMRIFVNRKQEWNQIYNESWRQMRDFFWDPTMHGVDWAAMRTKYQ
ncbi:MAG TPA: protease, partial [Bacteroidia bacterium]|nr:protease [Bacteroidia bacterium]